MTKKIAIIAVTGAVLVVAALGVFSWLGGNSAGNATSEDRALLTGYASSLPNAGPSGPVSVVLRGASAARIDRLVSGLPATNAPSCVEMPPLYQLNFTAVAGAKQGFDVTGFYCGGFVFITSGGKTATRIDRSCALLSAVRRLLPATATATQRLTPPCPR